METPGTFPVILSQENHNLKILNNKIPSGFGVSVIDFRN